VDNQELGRQLRALRTAAGRTVAAVAADAGLSVPYVANLENGRGNPTTTALGRLAEALGTRLAITLERRDGARHGSPDTPLPPSLVRLSRTHRFRRDVRVLAECVGENPQDIAAQLLRALSGIGAGLGRDLGEADWWRLLDAILLVGTHPHTAE
jgi:transcriptional regulator with XRE-family HTH domain